MNFADNNILLILISLVFIYAVLSILVSILTEAWSYYFKTRGIFLKDSIYKLLKDPLNKDYGYLFYNHITIDGLKSARDKQTQYISSRMFAEVLIDIIAQQAVHNRKIQVTTSEDDAKKYQLEGASDPETLTMIQRFELGVLEMNTSQFSDLMRSFLVKSDKNYDKLKAQIEQWFNDYMDRVSGWYKTKQRTKFRMFGFLVAISLNVDSLHLLKVLSLDDNLKNRLVESAEQTVDNLEKDSTMRNNITFIIKSVSIIKDSTSDLKTSSAEIAHMQEFLKKLDSSSRVKNLIAKKELHQLDSALNMVSELNIPIGWSKSVAPLSWFEEKKVKEVHLETLHDSKTPGLLAYLNYRNNSDDFSNKFKYFLGIIISGISLSFGAPFWFEILAKFVNIRRSGKIPEGDKSSKS